MGIKLEDLPTDADQLGTDAEIFFESGDDQVNAIVILAQLDPTEVVTVTKEDGDDSPGLVRREARWTEDQQKLILTAQEMFGTWEV